MQRVNVKPILCVFGNHSHRCFNQIYGKGVAHLWKNEGVAPLRELLYTFVVPGPPGTPDTQANIARILRTLGAATPA